MICELAQGVPSITRCNDQSSYLWSTSLYLISWSYSGVIFTAFPKFTCWCKCYFALLQNGLWKQENKHSEGEPFREKKSWEFYKKEAFFCRDESNLLSCICNLWLLLLKLFIYWSSQDIWSLNYQYFTQLWQSFVFSNELLC